MQKPVKPRSKAQNVKTPTFNVTQLSSQGLCNSRGVKLPPLSAKGQLLPEQVSNARFRLVEVDPQPLSDQQFNALIKRIVKCFMSEVEITKRLRKVTSARLGARPADVELIRHLEALRRTYETERSGLVVRLSRDCRYRFYASHTPLIVEEQSGKSCRVRKSKSLEMLTSSCEVPVNSVASTNDRVVRPSRKRQSGGFQPIVCKYIETPKDLSKRLRAKLYRLEKISKSLKSRKSLGSLRSQRSLKSLKSLKSLNKPSTADESVPNSQAATTTAVVGTDSLQESNSKEIFYDFLETKDF